MGYRSQIAIALPEHIQIPENIQEIFCSCESNKKSTLDEPLKEEFQVFYWDWIKWYESDKLINDTMNFLRSLDEDEYAFIRIGDEWDDLETAGNLDRYGIYYSRKIVFEGDTF